MGKEKTCDKPPMKPPDCTRVQFQRCLLEASRPLLYKKEYHYPVNSKVACSKTRHPTFVPSQLNVDADQIQEHSSQHRGSSIVSPRCNVDFKPNRTRDRSLEDSFMAVIFGHKTPEAQCEKRSVFFQCWRCFAASYEL